MAGKSLYQVLRDIDPLLSPFPLAPDRSHVSELMLWPWCLPG